MQFRLPLNSYPALVLIALSILGCVNFVFIPDLAVTDLVIGYRVQTDGHVAETRVIPANADTVYLEFLLDAPAETEVTLEFRWYFEDQLIHSYFGRHFSGNSIATLVRDPIEFSTLPTGNYKSEIWFLKTMLAEISFITE